MDNTDIVDQVEFNANEIIDYGEKISESVYKDVYRKDDEILKVVKDELKTDQMKRLGTFLPDNLIPHTLARTRDLSETESYSGLHTVIYQDSFDGRLDERLDSRDYGEIGDLIHLLDRIIEEDAAMADPVVENFNYFENDGDFLGGKLKPSDICDVESLKKFPDSFEQKGIETSFYEEITNMYEEAILSVSHETNLSMDKTAQIFKETSRHIREISLEPKLSLEEWPEVEVFPQ